MSDMRSLIKKIEERIEDLEEKKTKLRCNLESVRQVKRMHHRFVTQLDLLDLVAGSR